jgi:hypothetical protein
LGRGFGESVVLHLCDDDWVVVDSLLDRDKTSAALRYLLELGIRPERVRAILATHWHDDHIGGISELYRWASAAILAMPIVKTGRELVTYLEAQRPSGIGRVTSGVEELAKLVQVQREQGRPPARHCQADLVLVRKKSLATGVEITLTALSPVPADIEAFLVQLSAAAVHGQGTAARLLPFEPNDISVATWLAAGDEAVLLGADLENLARADRGWKAVLASRERPFGQASVYKVAHHGSSNADHPGIWDVLLQPKPIVALAPFNKGVGLPKRTDVQRILGLTADAYATNQTPFRRYRDATPIVRTALEADGIAIRAGNVDVGRVRFRKRVGADKPWDVTLSPNASHLKDFAAR